MLSCIGAGASIRMLAAFDAARIWREMERATVFMGVPTMHKKLFEALDDADVRSARDGCRMHAICGSLTSGSAALPVTLAERWREIIGRFRSSASA